MLNDFDRTEKGIVRAGCLFTIIMVVVAFAAIFIGIKLVQEVADVGLKGVIEEIWEGSDE